MNGIVINIDPMAIRLGYFSINWYSIIVTLAIIAAVIIAIYEGRKKGISAEHFLSLAPWVVCGGLVGARLFHVVDKWSYYSAHLPQILNIAQGGLAIWGGLAGGGIAVLVYTRLKHIPLGLMADVLVPALFAAQIIGRFACIINGDAAGGATTLPWGFIYMNPGSMIGNLYGVPTHPYPVYEQIWNLAGLALALKFRSHLKTNGQLFLGYLAFYAIGRLVFTFVRQESIWFWGLQEAQVIAIAILGISIGLMVYLSRKARDVSMPEIEGGLVK